MSSITKEFTKEQLIAAACSRIDFARQMLRGNPLPLAKRKWEIELSLSEIALASLEAEPVAYVSQSNLDALKRGHNDVFVKRTDDVARPVPLYTAPPAPVAVLDDNAITQHFDTIALETAREIMCDVNRRHEFLGGEVQLLSRIQCRIDDACRTAMLQGAEQTKYRAIVERIAEIIHGKVTDIDLLTVTVKSMKDKLQK